MALADAGGVFLRPLQADDAAALRLLHQQLFPLDYDDSFYQSAVNGLDGIVAWAASAPLPSLTCLSVDAANVGPQLVAPASSAAGRAELLAGFITARAFPALYADPHDRRLLGVEGAAMDRERLLYVLTLGVAQPYQRHGIARRLLDQVFRHAAETACRAVYLHVATFNQAALAFYRRAGFRELAVLPGFYCISTGRQPYPGCTSYDASLFGCIIAPPALTPWSAASLALQPLTSVIGSLNACLPWGPPRRKVSAGLDGGQQAGEPGEEQQQQQQQQADSSLVFRRHPPGGPFTQQPQPQYATSPTIGQSPDWLRQLFVRR